MLLDVVEAEGEDLDDDLKEDFRPIVFVVFGFSCHGGKNLCCYIYSLFCKLFVLSHKGTIKQSPGGSPHELFALRASER